MSQALLDTSVFVAREAGRGIDRMRTPEHVAVSAITIGELRAGVLVAVDGVARERRLATLLSALELEPLSVDRAVADAWARVRLALRNARTRMPANDSWIGATAIAHGLPVVTQDDDFDVLADLGLVEIIKV